MIYWLHTMKRIVFCLSVMVFVAVSTSAISLDPNPGAELISVKKVWGIEQSGKPHNAFTDLIRFKDQWYLGLREALKHHGGLEGKGRLRIIRSPDGEKWESCGLFESSEGDMRDAKLSITGENQLMLNTAIQVYYPNPDKHKNFAWFSKDGTDWSDPVLIGENNIWIWSVTWHDGVAYGVGYHTTGKSKTRLYRSDDGLNWEVLVSEFYTGNESSLVFEPDGTAICLMRTGNAIGKSTPPYREWIWKPTVNLGGPKLVMLDDGRFVAGGRTEWGTMVLFEINPETGKATELLKLPANGDSSYPGMVYHDGVLWVSYYSSSDNATEGGRYLVPTEIRLAKLKLSEPRISIDAAALKNEHVIQLENKREIFADYFLVEKIEGLQLIKHTPRDEGPVLYLNKPWEGVFSTYTTIIKDKDIYRAYYRGGVPGKNKPYSNEEFTCYAESRDGIKWDKPNLRLFEVNGSLENNVVLANEAPVHHNFSPFIDLNPKALKNQRYKALGGTRKDGIGLIPYASSDGIHWEKLHSEGVIKEGAFDSQNVAFWSESEKCYVCYFRTFNDGYRSVSRTTSDDFINWTLPVEMSFGDTPREHLYTQQTSPYFRAPHIYVAIGGRFMPGRQVLSGEQAKLLNVDPGYFKDCSDAFFMTSRGGNVYDRTFMEGFIRPGIGLDNWVSRSNYPALNVVQTGPSEMSIYVNQDYAQPTAHLRRYSLRLDGFSSVNAPYKGGELTTKPFRFSGHELEINYSTSAAGEIRIEIQDEDGIPIPGYSLADFQPIIGNEISRIVLWKGLSDLNKLNSKVIRLRIFMKDADLYSLKFN